MNVRQKLAQNCSHLIVSQITSDCIQQLFWFNPLITQNGDPGIGTNTDTVEVFDQDVGVQMIIPLITLTVNIDTWSVPYNSGAVSSTNGWLPCHSQLHHIGDIVLLELLGRCSHCYGISESD